MHKSIQRIMSLIIFLASSAVSGTLYAIDMSEYKKIAHETIEQARSGNIRDIIFLIKQQARLVELGVEASQAYAEEHPEAEKAISIVTEKADSMKKLNLMEIEEHWHSGKELEKNGITLGKEDHFGEMYSFIDSIIHPATSYIALVEYKKTGKREHLDQVVAELTEVLIHLDHLD